MKKKVLCLLLLGVILLCGCSQSNKTKLKNTLTHYDIKCEYNDETKSLSAYQKVDFFNYTDSVLDNICFHLHANAFRKGAKYGPVSLANYEKAYPNGVSYGDIQIEKVYLNDKDYEYSICGVDENILKVKLNGELYPNDRIIIEMEYTVQLANINHRLGYGENTISFGNFYPIVCVYEDGDFITQPYSSNGDPFYSKVASYNVEIIFDHDYTLACTGEFSQEEQDGKIKAVVSADFVRDFIFILSNKFKVKKQSVDGVEIKYYYYSDENPDWSLETAVKTLKTNSKLFGKYPYSSLSVVESNFVHGGMEYPMLVLISDDLPDEDTYQNVIVHEIGHQWWYGVVGNNQYTNGWLDEGLTEYTTALFYEHNEGYNATKENIISNAINSYQVFVRIYDSVYGKVNTDMLRDLSQYETEPEYVYVSYLKSMLLFDSLRNLIGDKAFFKALKSLYEEYSFMEIKPETLIMHFQNSTGKDLENFFKSWIEGKVLIMS